MPDGYGSQAPSIQEIYGADIAIKRVTIQMTKDSPTSAGIKELLPWLSTVKGYISGQFTGSAGLQNQLDKGDFQRGAE